MNEFDSEAYLIASIFRMGSDEVQRVYDIIIGNNKWSGLRKGTWNEHTCLVGREEEYYYET
jgi:hypothetical protein